MKRQTYEALAALAEALWNDNEGVNELHVYGNLPVQLINAVFDYAKEHAK